MVGEPQANTEPAECVEDTDAQDGTDTNARASFALANSGICTIKGRRDSHPSQQSTIMSAP